MTETYHADVLVLGGGLSGYSAALRARKAGAEVMLLSAGAGASPNVNGFCAWTDGREESLNFLKRMALEAGRGINRQKLLEAGLRNSAHAYQDLAAYGVPIRFDKGRTMATPNGPITCGYRTDEELGKCALPILRQAAQAQGIILLSGHVYAPLVQNGQIRGAIAVSEGIRHTILARSVVLAMGGLGRLFPSSTYPGDVSGAAAAFALAAGASVGDMEFLSYEPAVLCGLEQVGSMPLPTALYSKGCVLVNGLGERFMKTRYGIEERDMKKQGPLNKEWLAACIQREIREGRGTPNGGVWYDCRDVDWGEIERFTLKTARLQAAGVDLKTTPVEVRPQPHSHMGGVVVDETCMTDIGGLFACGEAVCGFYGAGRLAGFGGTSAVSLGDIAGASAARYAKTVGSILGGNVPRILRKARFSSPQEQVAIMKQAFPLYKQADALQEGISRLRKTQSNEMLDGDDPDTFAQAAAATLSLAVLLAADMRWESRGCFLREDYPTENPDHVHSIHFSLDSNGQLLANS